MAAPASNLTTAAYLFRRIFAGDKVANQAKRKHPLMAALMREGGFTGDGFEYPIAYGNPQGVGGTLGDAADAVSSSSGIKPVARRRAKFGLFTVNGEAMLAAATPGAFVKLLKHETDTTIDEVGDRLSFDLYGDGTGVRGQRGSLAGNVITLKNPADARNFKKNMKLVSDDSITGATPNAGSCKVTKVDRQQGKITVDNAAAMAGFADNDYLFAKGDPGTCIEGLSLQVPDTAPTAGDSFRGVDRSDDVELMSGIRVIDASVNTEDNIIEAATQVYDLGKTQDRCYINPVAFTQIARRRGAQIQYTQGGGTARISFQFIVIETPAGSLQVFADPDARPTRGYGMLMESIYIKHLEEYPHVVRDDGLTTLRTSASDGDGLEGRVRAFGNLIIPEPGSFSVFATNQ
jgi:hypothetical protein